MQHIEVQTEPRESLLIRPTNVPLKPMMVLLRAVAYLRELITQMLAIVRRVVDELERLRIAEVKNLWQIRHLKETDSDTRPSHHETSSRLQIRRP